VSKYTLVKAQARVAAIQLNTATHAIADHILTVFVLQSPRMKV
jgi:hypothetical protein